MDWQIILKQLTCTLATKNLKLNTKNRNAAIKDEDIRYRYNLDDEKYWEDVAEHWNTSVEVAKNQSVLIVLLLILAQE